MTDLQEILNSHHVAPKAKKKGVEAQKDQEELSPTMSEIPDLFFDEILVKWKLSRVEIMVAMYLYRQVWCRPNLYSKYGFSQILSHTEMSSGLRALLNEIHNAVRKLESLGFIEVMRAGQYFVRRYFTKEYDAKFGQKYDEF